MMLRMVRIIPIATTIAMAIMSTACSSEIYVRDGVTDGDTFYLAPRAFEDDDPALQAWVAYSLIKSACQLEIGGQNPARASSYGCEFSARQALVDTWEEYQLHQHRVENSYLDTLSRVREAGFLDEYTVQYFGRDDWLVPAEVDVDSFKQWQREHLRRHKPETRIIGSWNYRMR